MLKKIHKANMIQMFMVSLSFSHLTNNEFSKIHRDNKIIKIKHI